MYCRVENYNRYVICNLCSLGYCIIYNRSVISYYTSNFAFKFRNNFYLTSHINFTLIVGNEKAREATVAVRYVQNPEEFDDIFTRHDSSHHTARTTPFDLGCFPFPVSPPPVFSSTLVSLFRPRDLIRTSSQKRCVWIFPFAPSKNRGNPGQELNHSQARLIDVFASNGTMYSRQRCNVVLGRDSVHRGNGKTFKAPRNTKCSCVRYLCESRR